MDTMTRPSSHAGRFSQRLSRARSLAFTLIELVATVVIFGVLAALAVPALDAVVDRSHDEVARVELIALHRAAAAESALDGSDITFSGLTLAAVLPSAQAADRAPAARFAGFKMLPMQAPDATVSGAPRMEGGDGPTTPSSNGASSEAHGELSWAAYGTPDLALAMRSNSGRCVRIYAESSSLESSDVRDEPVGSCAVMSPADPANFYAGTFNVQVQDNETIAAQWGPINNAVRYELQRAACPAADGCSWIDTASVDMPFGVDQGELRNHTDADVYRGERWWYRLRAELRDGTMTEWQHDDDLLPQQWQTRVRNVDDAQSLLTRRVQNRSTTRWTTSTTIRTRSDRITHPGGYTAWRRVSDSRVFYSTNGVPDNREWQLCRGAYTHEFERVSFYFRSGWCMRRVETRSLNPDTYSWTAYYDVSSCWQTTSRRCSSRTETTTHFGYTSWSTSSQQLVNNCTPSTSTFTRVRCLGSSGFTPVFAAWGDWEDLEYSVTGATPSCSTATVVGTDPNSWPEQERQCQALATTRPGGPVPGAVW